LTCENATLPVKAIGRERIVPGTMPAHGRIEGLGAATGDSRPSCGTGWSWWCGRLAVGRRWAHVTHQPPAHGAAGSWGPVALPGCLPVCRSRSVLSDLIVRPVHGTAGGGEGYLRRVPGPAW